ncbi:cytochrome P450 4e2-like [Musca domestica]|uniref:Cytochrome P450 4e2-like n=1 Tax=Musca domestica TaxID=7370 RepID=A0ABM3UMR7_MUSDO|nr:cytochrome P450 4e2-like [Musca domestica]
MAGNLKGNATLQDLNEMKYLDCVIKESMRIYPPVLFFGRNVEKEYNMNGKTIPAHTSLLIFVIAMNYNEAIYPDPYRFDPQRFDADQRMTTQNPFEYVPFGGGQRNCIGQKFAMLEVKTVISKIVRNFQILAPEDGLESKDGYISTLYGPQRARAPKPDKYVPTLLHAITLRAESGLHLRLRERK